MGGPLILSGIRPYIDGRGDMYGDDLVARLFAHRSTATPRAFDDAVQPLEHPLGDPAAADKQA